MNIEQYCSPSILELDCIDPYNTINRQGSRGSEDGWWEKHTSATHGKLAKQLLLFQDHTWQAGGTTHSKGHDP
jgi:hypothetical protein